MTSLLVLAILTSAGNRQTYDVEINSAVEDVRHVFPVPRELVTAVIHQESGFNPMAISRTGAIGLMQVMPYNAPLVGLKKDDLWNPALNILAGTRLLAVLLRHYDGDYVSVLVAYNAGPRARSAPIPQNGETPGYVRAVLSALRPQRTTKAARSLGRRSVFIFGAPL